MSDIIDIPQEDIQVNPLASEQATPAPTTNIRFDKLDSVQKRTLRKEYKRLRELGLTPREAGEKVGYSKASSASIYKNLENPLQKSILSPLVALAKQAVENTLKGIPTGDAAPPKTSDVLHATEMVLDREDPKITKTENKSMHVSIQLTDQDREKYRKRLGFSSDVERQSPQ